MNYILSLDQGTSSSRAIIFDKEAQVIKVEQSELEQFYPKDNWVEQSAESIWESQLKVAKQAIGQYTDSISAIGITNQRETVDRYTEKP